MIGHYGGDLAGPVFRRVAEASLRYLGVTPSAASAKLQAVTRAGDLADTTLAAMHAGRAPVQLPRAGGLERRGTKDAVRVPDATGMAMRDAIRAISGAGLVPADRRARARSSGRPLRRRRRARRGASVRLVFEPAS